MKKILNTRVFRGSGLILLIMISVQCFSQGINIESGAAINCTGSASIQIDNGNFVNNGSYTKGNETFTLSGSSTSRTISGNSNTDLNNLSITNSAGVTTQLGLLTVNNLNIANGCSFLIGTGKHVTVISDISNNAGSTGLTLLGNASGSASLKCSTTGIAATVQKYINTDGAWHFIASPVNQQDIWPDFTPAPFGNTFGTGPFDWDFYYFNPNAELTYPHLPWVNIRKTGGDYNDNAIDETGDAAGFGSAIPKFQPVRGYLITYGSTFGTSDHSFVGSLNAGIKTYNVTNNTTNCFNLAGNPYPSSIDWKAGSGWDRSPLDGDDLTNGRDYWCWNESAGNYGTYNSIDLDDSGTNGTGRYIAPMQGFFVAAKESGMISLNDDVRAHSSQTWLKNTTSGYFLKVNLSTEMTSYFDEVAVKVDPSYAGNGTVKFASLLEEAPEIYILDRNNQLSVVRLPHLDENDMLPIGIKTGMSGHYYLTATNLESFGMTDILLEDKKVNITHDFRNNPVYGFFSEAGDDASRFILHFSKANGIDNLETESQFHVFLYNGDVVIEPKSAVDKTFDVTITSLLGQVLFDENFNSIEPVRIRIHQPSKVLLVRIKTSSKCFSKKILLNP